MPVIRCSSSSTTSTSSSAPIGSLTSGLMPATKVVTSSRTARPRTLPRARPVTPAASCANFWQHQDTLCLQAGPLIPFPVTPALSLMESLHDFDALHCDHEPTPNPSQEGNWDGARECVLPSWEGS